MMHPTEIARLSRAASAKASRERLLPLVVEQEDLDRLDDEALLRHVGKAPFLGESYSPRDFALSEELFIDISGFGADYEPALSHQQLVHKVRELGPGVGYGILTHGQFQAYLGVYRPS